MLVEHITHTQYRRVRLNASTTVYNSCTSELLRGFGVWADLFRSCIRQACESQLARGDFCASSCVLPLALAHGDGSIGMASAWRVRNGTLTAGTTLLQRRRDPPLGDS